MDDKQQRKHKKERQELLRPEDNIRVNSSLCAIGVCNRAQLEGLVDEDWPPDSLKNTFSILKHKKLRKPQKVYPNKGLNGNYINGKFRTAELWEKQKKIVSS